MELPPEIILFIGQLLLSQDLTCCIRVSKTWRQALVPLLYRFIDETRKKKPRILTLDKHVHLIQHARVIFGGPFMNQLINRISMPNLRQLCLISRLDVVLTQPTCILSRFFPCLVILSVESSGRHTTGILIESILDLCLPSLQELHLERTHLSKSAVKLVIDLGSSLKKLSLHLCTFDTADSSILLTVASGNVPRFPCVSDLKIDDSECRMDLGAWLENCPNVRTLEWRSSAYSMENRVLSIMAPQWSHIRSLSLSGNTFELTDHQLSQILEACAPLTMLNVSPLCFSIKCYFSLERHFATLDDLNLEHCKDLQSWMIQSILSSCSKLVFFRSWVLHAYDLIQSPDAEIQQRQALDLEFRNAVKEPALQEEELPLREGQYSRKFARGRPWVCLGLRELTVTIAETKPEWQVSIFKRISTLTELRVLDIGMNMNDFGMPSLDLSLKSGLENLKSLKNLERLNFYGTHQIMKERDVQWMLQAWPCLKDITREFNPTPKKNAKLCKLVDRYIGEIDSDDEDPFC